MITLSQRFILCAFFLQQPLIADSDQSLEKKLQSHPQSLPGSQPPKKKANSPANTSGRSEGCHKPCKVSKGPKGKQEKQYQSGIVKVSYYNLPGKKTANGEMFRQERLTAAHKTLPFNTLVSLSNTTTGKSVTVRINDRGPFVAGRSVDVSKGAARKLGIVDMGVSSLKMIILYQPPQASKT